MPARYPRRLLEPYDPIFDAKEATRCVRESLEQLARFRSRLWDRSRQFRRLLRLRSSSLPPRLFATNHYSRISIPPPPHQPVAQICTSCGIIGADMRPNWRERWCLVSRLSGSLEQFAADRHVVVMAERFVPRRVIKAPGLPVSSQGPLASTRGAPPV